MVWWILIRTQVTSSASYQNSLSVDCKAEGRFSAYKFSASTNYQSVSTGVQAFNKVYVESVAKCIMYRVQTKPVFKVSKTFAEQVNIFARAGERKILRGLPLRQSMFQFILESLCRGSNILFNIS